MEMNLIEIAKKLGSLLKEETIFFDHKSYDYAEDIPHVFMDGKRYNVVSVTFSADGMDIGIDVIDISEHKLDGFGISLREDLENGVTTEVILKEAEEMGLDALFHDVYYETDYSYEIGDFETDFLGV